MVQISTEAFAAFSGADVTTSSVESVIATPSGRTIDKAANNPKLRALHEYWASKCQGNSLPSYRDIRPEEIPHLLSSLLVWDVIRDGRDFVVRLAGSTVEEVFGRSMRGLTVSEVINETNLPITLTQMLGAVVEGQPAYITYHICPTQGQCLRIERVLLPLANDGVAVDCLLGGFDFKILSDCGIPRSALPSYRI